MSLLRSSVTRRKREQKEEQERLLKAKKKMTQKRDMKVPRILSHMKPEGGQRRKRPQLLGISM